jgi:hypothetical protein
LVVDLTVKKIIIIVLSVAFATALIAVQWVEIGRERGGPAKRAVAGEQAQVCIDCHGDQDGSPKLIAAWQDSIHAEQGVDCMSCHSIVDDDSWDEFTCPGSTIPVATHPTPKDCSACHEQAVTEFARSKHGATAMIFFSKSFDRTVFEPTIATKHGCQECHGIGHFWPDQSVGECDACHPKHSFDVAVARDPNSCSECHIGPDHPHIEIYLESKHGNIYSSRGHEWDWNYPVDELVPFDSPTCSTCHMGKVGELASTHDVGERLAWEIQSPFTIRTTGAWGNGLPWEDKRRNMERVCYQCHGQPFVDRYLLTADLSVLQYNEIFKNVKYWLNEMNDAGIILTPGFEGLAAFTVAGYDQLPEQISYHVWHHEGRRYRAGAIMMGADYTQWHGIWDLQHDLMELIEYAADYGLPEAQAWMESPDPAKFWLYPFYDIPGSAWGIDTIAYRKSEEFTTKILMNRDEMPDYWDRVQSNVAAVYDHGLLTDDQWELWQELYANIDRENGQIFALPPDFDLHTAGLAIDSQAVTDQVLELELPGQPGWVWDGE